MIIIAAFLVISPFLYSFILPFSESIFIRFLVGQISFWAINAGMAFLFRFISLPLNIFLIFSVHILIMGVTWRYFYNRQKRVLWRLQDAISFFVMILSGICLLVGSVGFEGVIAVLSFSWDMAVHFLITTDIANTFQVNIPAYPFGFHVNAFVAMQALLTPIGQIHNVIQRTSVFSLFIVYCLICLFGVFAYIAAPHFQSQNQKINAKILESLASGLFSFFMLSLVVVPLLWQGFISVLFMILVMFSFIAFEDVKGVSSELKTLVLGFTAFLLGVSYSYLSPVFIIYHCIRYIQTKEKKYLLFFLIQIIPTLDIILSSVSQNNSPAHIVSLWGWFVPFPLEMIICFAIGTSIYIYKKMKEKPYVFSSADILFILICLCFGGLFIYQGKMSYSLFKLSVPLISLLIYYTCLSVNSLIERLGIKLKGFMNPGKLFILSLLLIFTYKIFLSLLSMGGLPGIDQVPKGRLRFFENNPHMFQVYKRAWEKMGNYDELILFDQSLNRLQWWVAYVGNKTPVKNRIHSQYQQQQDIEYYERWIKEMPSSKRLLIVDPYFMLLRDCKSDAIKAALKKEKKIDFLIPFSVEEYQKKCGK